MATTGPKVLHEHGPEPVPAAPAAEPLDGAGEPLVAPDPLVSAQDGHPADPRGPQPLGGDAGEVVGRDLGPARSLVGLATLSSDTAEDDAEPVHQPPVEAAGAPQHDAPPADGHLAEEGRPATLVLATGARLDGELPMISDQAWEWMEPMLPSSTGRRGRRWRDHRQVVEAICWKYRTGSPWRDLPARFGPWQTAYQRLTRWSADGTWASLLAKARTDADAAGELDWLVAVDSTAVRAQRHGAGTERIGGNAATASPDRREDGAAA